MSELTEFLIYIAIAEFIFILFLGFIYLSSEKDNLSLRQIIRNQIEQIELMKKLNPNP